MTDSGIKKVFYKSEDFPLVQFSTHMVANREEILDLYYAFRYRILSEDKNRFSHWSPIKKIVMPDVTTPFPYTSDARITISKSGNPEVITTIWTKPETQTAYEAVFNKINIYDVWIRWNETNNANGTTPGWTPWEYSITLSSNTFSILKQNPLYKTVEVAIQIPTTRKLRDYNNNKLTLFRKTGAV